MKHLAAYLLLHLTHPAPSKEDVTDLLATVGIEPDVQKLDKLYKLLEGRDVNELMEEGSKKLAGALMAGGGSGGGGVAKVEERRGVDTVAGEEKKEAEEEKDEDEEDEGGFGDLFGDM